MGLPLEPLSIAFITRTRDDLVGVSRTLAANLKPETLDDPDNPVIWSNWGSWMSGKSLIGDEIVFYISGQSIAGNDYIGMYDCGDKQYVCHEFPQYVDNELESLEDARNEILDFWKEKRTKGGINFFHNANDALKEKDIEIRLSAYKHSNFYLDDGDSIAALVNSEHPNIPYLGDFDDIKKHGLQAYFDSANNATNGVWTRLIEITFHNPDIFVPEFIEKLRTVERISQEIRESRNESALCAIHPN